MPSRRTRTSPERTRDVSSRFAPRRRRVGVGDRRDASLVVTDEDPSVRDRRAVLALARERDRRVVVERRREARRRIGVGVRRRVRARRRPGRSPLRAKPSQSSFWFAPPKRIRSAARYASRAWSIDGSVGISSNASNTSWTQRRLPGQVCGGSSPVGAALLQVLVVEREVVVVLVDQQPARMRKFVALQISPSAWTSRAGDVVAHVAEVQRVDHELLARLRNAAGHREVHPVVADRRAACCRWRTCRPRSGSRRRSGRSRSRSGTPSPIRSPKRLAHRAGVVAGTGAPLPIMRFSIMCRTRGR